MSQDGKIGQCVSEFLISHGGIRKHACAEVSLTDARARCLSDVRYCVYGFLRSAGGGLSCAMSARVSAVSWGRWSLFPSIPWQ